MTADSGASSHLIEQQLLPDIQLKMNHDVLLYPPVTISVGEIIALMALVRVFGRSRLDHIDRL